MELDALREKLHSLIDSSSEARLIELYDLFEQDYTDDFKMQLEEEYASYKKDKQVISKEVIDKAVNEMLHGK